MGLNPDTQRFESLDPVESEEKKKLLEELRDGLQTFLTDLVRPDGSPVPETWLVVALGELIEIKGHTFEVAYIGEGCLMLEPKAIELPGPGEVK